MKKRLKKIPKFRNEDEEAEFWSTHDSTDYVDWSKAKIGLFPNLKPTTRPISLRIPEIVISKVKVQANKLNIPYQSLMKQYIAKGVDSEAQIVANLPRRQAGKSARYRIRISR